MKLLTCVLCNLIHEDFAAEIRAQTSVSPWILFSTHKHTLSTVRSICELGPSQRVQYERAYIYRQAGRRQEPVSLSHTVWCIVRGHYCNSHFTVCPIGSCYPSLCLSTSTKLRDISVWAGRWGQTFYQDIGFLLDCYWWKLYNNWKCFIGLLYFPACGLSCDG